MQPHEARAQLLREHESLRVLVSDALAVAAALRHGEAVADDLRRALDALREAFVAHNQSEETVLEPILREHPEVGAARVARMFEEHVAEHAAFRAALAGDVVEVATRLDELAEDLDAHMAAEERTFLSPGVLRP